MAQGNSYSTSIRPLRVTTPEDAQYTEFDLVFERALVYALCTEPRAWRLVGPYIVPECLKDARGKLCLDAARYIAKHDGEGPSNTLLIAQHLAGLRAAGKATQQQLEDSMELLEEVEDSAGGALSGTDVDTAIRVAAGVVRTRLRNDVVRKMIAASGKDKSISKYIQDISLIEAIGQETALGAQLFGSGIWAGIQADANDVRLPCGISDIDGPMNGGTTSKTLTIYAADPGQGKSAMLIHQCGFSLLSGLRCIYVTLEETVPKINTRMASFLTGQLTDEVALGGSHIQDQLDRVTGSPGFGCLAIEYLPAGSTIAQLKALLAKIRKDLPEFVDGWDVLFVDYLDVPELLAGSNSSDQSHQQVKQVTRELRSIAVENGNWVVTASQLKARDHKSHPKQTDLSDGRGKGVAADVVITIFQENETSPDERTFYIAKCRGTGAGHKTNPIPHELYRGRMSVLSPNELMTKLDKMEKE